MSQVVPTCDPLYVQIDGNERVRCHDGGIPMWETVPVEEMTSIWQPMTLADATLITGSILGIWAIAFGFKFVYNQIMSGRPGRY